MVKARRLSYQLDLSDKAENSSAVALRIASAGFGTRCKLKQKK